MKYIRIRNIYFFLRRPANAYLQIIIRNNLVIRTHSSFGESKLFVCFIFATQTILQFG